MREPRWAPFLTIVDNQHYGQGYRDDSLSHTDYKKAIHISLENRLNIKIDTEFDYGGHKMKAINVQDCSEFKNHCYIFAREIL